MHGEKMIGHGRNILGDFPQSRRLNANHFQAIIQIGAKRTGFARFVEILIACGNDSDVNRNRSLTTDAIDGAFLQDAQYLGLSGETQVADFIEKESSSI